MSLMKLLLDIIWLQSMSSNVICPQDTSLDNTEVHQILNPLNGVKCQRYTIIFPWQFIYISNLLLVRAV